MADDSHLLRRFVDDSSQEAFTTLVERHVNLVYSAAQRQLGGDAHLARDATQAVFLALAQNAPRLVYHAALTGWLYTCTRFIAGKIVRQRRRQQAREEAAEVMRDILSGNEVEGKEPDWNEIRPVIDAAMHELPSIDREAILLRIFEGRSFAELGTVCGVSENAARMRFERALERLRQRLARRGITSTATALGATLAARTIVAAPSGLASAAAASGTAAFMSAAPGLTVTVAHRLVEFMSISKVVLAAAGIVIAYGVGSYAGSHHGFLGIASVPERLNESSEIVAMLAENQRLRQELFAQRTTANANAALTPSAGATPPPVGLERLRILAELEKNKVAHTAITFVNAKGEITDAFADLFALTSTERGVLQQAISAARERLITLEQESAIVTRNDKGGVVISVKPFAQEGGVVYDGLIKSFENTLGPDRIASYVTLGADQVEKALGGFGTAERTVTFDYDPRSAARGEPYVLRDQLRQPNSSGRGVSTSTSTSEFKTFEDMADRAGTISKLLPADFVRK